jgi:hypothetical protein
MQRALTSAIDPPKKGSGVAAMNRAAWDNALLADCERVYDGLAKLCVKIFATGGVIGCVWYACVLARANGWL